MPYVLTLWELSPLPGRTFPKVTVTRSTLPKPPNLMSTSALFTSYMFLGTLLSWQEMGSTVRVPCYGFLCHLTAISYLWHSTEAVSVARVLPLGFCQEVPFLLTPKYQLFSQVITAYSFIMSIMRPLSLGQVSLEDSALGSKVVRKMQMVQQVWWVKKSFSLENQAGLYSWGKTAFTVVAPWLLPSEQTLSPYQISILQDRCY